MRFKTLFPALLGLVLMLNITGCTKVESGNSAVRVSLYGDDKGDIETLPAGKYWPEVGKEIYKFPTFTQNYVWTASEDEGSPNNESIDFQTKDGLRVNGDFGIAYHIEPENVKTVFLKYRRGVDEITDVFMRNMVRDALSTAGSKMGVENVYGKGKITMMEQVNAAVKATAAESGLTVENVYIVGTLRFPEQVEQSINAKIAATQKAQQRENEIREAEAEAKKVEAAANGEAAAKLTVAKAEAEANQIISKSLTPELVRYQTVLKWDGQLPKVNGSSAGLMINADSMFAPQQQ